jgi:TolB-like protein/Tfp pilus assembly protein PilF
LINNKHIVTNINSVLSYCFEGFILDAEQGRLIDRNGAEVLLRPKAVEVLQHLSEHAGRVVPREALMTAVWPNVFVTDDSITQCVTEIRRGLGEAGPRLLRTLPRRGYLLAATVTREAVTPSARALAAPFRPMQDDRPSIVVLPFRQEPGGAKEDWFADGITEGIIHVLSGIENLFVIAHGSSLSYAGIDPDPRVVARDLGVRYVLRGTVRRFCQQVRVATQLLDANAGSILRADRLDGVTADLFDLQDRVATQVVVSIAPTVRHHELQRAMRKPTGSITAYDLVLQALDLMPRLDCDVNDHARRLLEQATGLDPDYALPRSYIALWHLIRIAQGWSTNPDQDAALAARNAAVALERDHNNATALAIQGHMLSYAQRDFAAGAVTLDRAIALGPNNPMAWTFRAATSGYVGDGERAVREAEHAIKLSPLDPFVHLSEQALSQAHYIAGDYAAAVRWGRQVAARNDRHAANLRILTASLMANGEAKAAREVAARLLAQYPNFHLDGFKARTPLIGGILERIVSHLRAAGLPD